MQTTVLTVQSKFDGLALQVTIAEPDGLAKGVIQISHGMCEYVQRYQGMMEFFTAKGYVVAGNDHRGHGGSVKEKGDLGYFYEKKGKAVVEDLVTVTEFLKERYAGLPIYLFGHSMGSMAARCYLQENDGLIDKAIICGAPAQNAMAGVAIFLADFIALFKGERHRSKMLATLAVGNGDKRFPGEGKNAWLTKNPENVAKYNVDEYCSYTFTCNGFRNLFCLLKNTYQKRLYRVQNPTLPIYFIAGEDDPVIVSTKAWEKAIAFLKKCGYTNVSQRLYQGLRHEILNEKESEQVMEELLAFLEA